MLVGNPNEFAIESEIAKAYHSLGSRALGFFNIHIKARRYGVHKPDATLLACSYDTVSERIDSTGKHKFEVPEKMNGMEIFTSFLKSYYAGDENSDFGNALVANRIAWAPDGDEAFDDGSNILHFDHGDRVRLLGGVNSDAYEPELGSFRELWIDANTFYSVLEDWRSGFDVEWKNTLAQQFDLKLKETALKLEAMRAPNADLSDNLSIKFIYEFHDEHWSRSFLESALSQGLTTKANELSAGGPWEVLVSQNLKRDALIITEAKDTLDELAVQHGGEPAGWTPSIGELQR